MLVKRRSTLTGKIHVLELPVTAAQLMAYDSGELLQEAFPNLNASQREFIKNGITEQEWDEHFPEEDSDRVF